MISRFCRTPQHGMFAAMLSPAVVAFLAVFLVMAFAPPVLVAEDDAVAAVLRPRVVATFNDGETVEGTWTSVTQDGIEISRDGTPSVRASVDLMSLVNTRATPVPAGAVIVLLASGSRLSADAVRGEQDELSIELRRQPVFRVALKKVRAIRFGKPSPTTDPVWLGMLEKATRGDRVVIRRKGNKLDSAEGVIGAISDESVRFSLDGSDIDVPIKRLEGIVFGASEQVDDPPDIQVTDIYGTNWRAERLRPVRWESPGPSPELTLEIDAKTSHRIPVSLVRQIRWSGSLRWLAQSDPADVSLQTEFAIALDQGLHLSWFGPQAKPGLATAGSQSSPSSISAAGSSETDLILHGGTMVEYRVGGDDRVFSGAVRRAQSVHRGSTATVRILIDDQIVWENELPDADPLGFELELKQARRIKIHVDSGNDGDRGVIVRMVRPRFIR